VAGALADHEVGPGPAREDVLVQVPRVDLDPDAPGHGAQVAVGERRELPVEGMGGEVAGAQRAEARSVAATR
jgi:hypothetical protein